MDPSVPPSPAQPNRPVVFPTGFPSINMTVGAVTISTWCSVFAFGVVCSAAYIYYIQFPRDRLWFKILAGAIWLVAAVDTIANLVWAYEWTVTLWGSIPGAGLLPYAFYINIFCDATATSITQLFYAWRLWLISGGNYFLTGAIVLAALTQQFVVIWALSVWGRHNVLFKDLGVVLPGAYGWLIAGIIGDSIISASMFYYLRLKTRDTPSQSKTTFNAIISRTVQANVFSLISQTLTFVLFKIDAGMFFFLNDVVMAKVYAFSLLTSLNARRSSTALFNLSKSVTSTAGGMTNGISLGQTTFGGSGRRGPVVRITETVDVTTEHDYASAYSPSSKAEIDWDAKSRSPDQSQTNVRLPERETDVATAV
ncbi:hypothetical protein AURDEDRAFT_112276 [Auricularia subglabra TFB-10046 SS5]|nr:hypothetical protein AURDEDRAFT_112276 [Auricularia subglabra TFB-10046 SS5]